MQICRELCRQGIEAEVATTDADVHGNISIPLGQPVDMEGVTVHAFRCPFLRRYGFSTGLTRWLKEHLREYAILHIHAFFSYVALPATYYATRWDIPYIIRPCGELDPWPLKKNRLAKQAFFTFVGSRILNRAAAIHATSEMEKTALERLGLNAPVWAIPLGVELPSENGLPPHGQFRKQYPGLNRKKLILFLSRIDPKKGLDLLLPALKRLREKRNDVVLAIAGSGPPAFERQIRHRVKDLGLDDLVIFCGFLDKQRKWMALRDADLFVLPSYDENFGLAVVEALGMSVPVVISDRVGIHHEVRECGAGLVVRCDAQEIADAIGKLLDDGALRLRMGENGRRLVEQKFTWPKVASRLIDLYKVIVSETGSKRASNTPLWK
jgi:glycosyltransferase involved in cell wall biosynthesis